MRILATIFLLCKAATVYTHSGHARGGVSALAEPEGLLTLLVLYALPGGPTFVRQYPLGHAK